MLIRHATGNLVELFENIHKTWPATYSATFGVCFLFGDGVLNVHTVQFDIRLFRRVKLPIIIYSISTYTPTVYAQDAKSSGTVCHF